MPARHFAPHLPGQGGHHHDPKPRCERERERDDDNCRPRRPKHPCKHKPQGKSKKKHCR